MIMRLAGLVLAGLLLGGPAFAVDTPTTRDAPDLARVRAEIKAKNFTSAIAGLQTLIDQGVQHPDVYSLLGFSLRKSGDQKSAQTFYRKALDFDPNHKGALEYQGELFVEMGDTAKARGNLARLVALCPSGCEEREDLEKALGTVAASH